MIMIIFGGLFLSLFPQLEEHFELVPEVPIAIERWRSFVVDGNPVWSHRTPAIQRSSCTSSGIRRRIMLSLESWNGRIE